MKKTKLRISLLALVTISTLFVSCQKEELSESLEVTVADDLEFTNLIYKGTTYSQQQVNEDETLTNLVNTSEYTFTDVTEGDNIEEQVNIYVYDSKSEQLAHTNILNEQAEMDSKNDDLQARTRLIISFYDRGNQKGSLLYRRTKFGAIGRIFREKFNGSRRYANDRINSYSIEIRNYPGSVIPRVFNRFNYSGLASFHFDIVHDGNTYRKDLRIKNKASSYELQLIRTD